MSLVLYRSGGLTPLERIPVKNPWFDFLSKPHQKPYHSPRSSSVFATLTFKEAEQWVPWRQDMGMNADIYKITVPSDAKFYAHACHYYETAGFLRIMPEYAVEGEFERALQAYWDTGVQVTETLDVKDEFHEVLLPYHIAVQCVWEKIIEVEMPQFEDVPTYFDSVDA